MKKFILGFITGGIICATVTGLAVEYAVTANPFPVKVNGVETAIEGYNINDATFFKLRDVADAVGGFDVDFKDNTIVLETQAAAEVAPTPTPTVKPNLSPLPDIPIKTVDGEKYVDKLDIEAMLTDIGLGDYDFAGSYFYKKGSTENILDDIPLCENDNLLIPLSYYTSIIIPAINSLR